MQNIIKNIKEILSQSEEFLQKKMEDHKTLTVAMAILVKFALQLE